ncbi:hypothetical protein Hanom_Chr03g00258971 [Helianthus anomalus]
MQEKSSPNRTLGLASALDIGTSRNKLPGHHNSCSGIIRSVVTFAYCILHFAF